MVNIKNLKANELRTALKNRNLDTTGLKATLYARLNNALGNNNGDGSDEDDNIMQPEEPAPVVLPTAVTDHSKALQILKDAEEFVGEHDRLITGPADSLVAGTSDVAWKFFRLSKESKLNFEEEHKDDTPKAQMKRNQIHAVHCLLCLSDIMKDAKESKGHPMVKGDTVTFEYSKKVCRAGVAQLKTHLRKVHNVDLGETVKEEVVGEKRQKRPKCSPSLDTLKEQMARFAETRDWDQFHTPRNLLLAMVGEVGELSELFQWRGEAKVGLEDWSEIDKHRVGEEMSDVLLYLVRMADVCGIDLGTAARNKMKLNRQKYPIHLVKGKSKKSDEYTQEERDIATANMKKARKLAKAQAGSSADASAAADLIVISNERDM